MKQTANMLMVILLSALFLSCKKENIETNAEVPISTFPVTKIFAWLDAEKAKAAPDSANRIDMLKQNLLIEQISEEKPGNNQNVVVIPLKEDFKTINSTQLHSFKKLILKVSNGLIINGSIVELIPRGENRIRTNLSAFINKETAGFNGIASNLSIFGRFVSEDVYKDGKLYSTTQLIAKPKDKKVNDTSQISTLNFSFITCYDWYIITTYYNRDGSVAYKTYDYVGTTCDGSLPCILNRIVTNTSSYFKSCGGSGTGGDLGGGGGEEEDNAVCDLNQEAAQQELDGILFNEAGVVKYSIGDPLSNSLGIIKEPVTVSFPIFSLQFTTGYWIRYSGHGSGIRYKVNPTDTWKWESFQKSSQVTKDNIFPACWTDDMTVTISNPVFSSDHESATLAVSYNLTLGLSCLGGQKIKNYSGSHPVIVDANF
jgi:hypothetical protein